MSSESLRTVRDRFSEFIDRVQSHHERVIVTKNGTPAAVLISPEDLESLEETAAVIGDSDAVAELVAAQRHPLLVRHFAVGPVVEIDLAAGRLAQPAQQVE